MKHNPDFRILTDRSDAVILDVPDGVPIPLTFSSFRNQGAQDMADLFMDLAWSRGISLRDLTNAVAWPLYRDLERIVDAGAFDDCRTNSCERTAFSPAVYCCEDCEAEGKEEYESEQVYRRRVAELRAGGMADDAAYQVANDEESDRIAAAREPIEQKGEVAA